MQSLKRRKEDASSQPFSFQMLLIVVVSCCSLAIIMLINVTLHQIEIVFSRTPYNAIPRLLITIDPNQNSFPPVHFKYSLSKG